MASSRHNTKTAAQLEDLCERATAAASHRAGRRLDWKPKDREGFWTFHCPLPVPTMTRTHGTASHERAPS